MLFANSTIRILFASVCLLLLVPSVAPAEGLCVEQLQRDLQVRYHMLRGRYHQWPKCSSRDTPAPQYPKDGYYGDITLDPQKGVELVRDLVIKFYGPEAVYTDFVVAPNGYSDLDNTADIKTFSSTDMEPAPDPAAINEGNYLEVLQGMRTQLNRLLLVKVPAWQSIGATDSKETGAYDANTTTSCGAQESCVRSKHSSTEWGEHVMYHGACAFDGSQPYAKNKIGAAFGSGLNRISYYQYIAAAWNTRGRITADLVRFPHGSAKIYLKLARAYCFGSDYAVYLNSRVETFAGTRPTTADENRYGLWQDGILNVGSVSSSDYVSSSEEIQPDSGDCAEEVFDVRGWQVEDQVVVVAPDFTTKPDTQDCCACAACEPGSISTEPGFVRLNVDFGNENFGGSAGAITLSADMPSTALATLSALRYSVANNNVEAISDGTPPSSHLQFKTSQALLDLQAHDPYSYTISTFSAGNIGPKNGDFYTTTGPASSTTVVSNPDGGSSCNRLRIIHTKGVASSLAEYTFVAETGTWDLSTGDGLRRVSTSSVWSAPDSRTERVTIRNELNEVTYTEENTYLLYPWGQERIQRVIDPDGAALRSTWSFYDDAANDGASYRQLKEEVDFKSHWVRYYYDSAGREIKRVSQWLDAPVGSADNLNRVLTTSYSTSDPQITTVETIQGHIVARREKIIRSDEIQEIMWRTPAGNGSSDKLVAITKKYTTEPFKGEIRSVERPDGTMDMFTYSLGSGTRTEILESGVPNTDKTSITDGTRTVTVTGSLGQMISRHVTDILSGKSLAAEQYGAYDEFNRPEQVVFMDGTSRSTHYGCCGPEYAIDRDGVRTDFLYDALGRQNGEVKYGITLRRTLDPDGRVLIESRSATDNSNTVLRQTKYDLAGRVIAEVNGLQGTTTTAYGIANHRSYVTKTFPDGGQRIEVYFPDGQLERIIGSAVFPVRYEYGAIDGGTYAKEVKLKQDPNYTDSEEWTKVYTDMLGRSYKTVYSDNTPATEADNARRESSYNSRGQIWKEQDPDNVTALFTYNLRGEREYTIAALQASTRDLADYESLLSSLAAIKGGTDRVTRTLTDIVSAHGTEVRRTRTFVCPDHASGTELLTSMVEASIDDLHTWSTVYRDPTTLVTTETHTALNSDDGLLAAGFRTVTTILPDSTRSVRVYEGGRLKSVSKRPANGNTPTTQTIYGYDKNGLQATVTDARNGTTTRLYNAADLVTSVTTPDPAVIGGAPQTILTHYNKMLQVTNVTHPDGTRVTNEYYLTGLLKRRYGSRTYPVAYGYDAQGRLACMTNWSWFDMNGPGTSARVTSWSYDSHRGWLANKRYPDGLSGLPGGLGADYTYTQAGRLKTRAWARAGTEGQRIRTIYTYGFDDAASDNEHGDLVEVTYANDPQQTPTVSTMYDRRGRPSQIARAGITTTFTYNDADQQTIEQYSGFPLNGMATTTSYNPVLQRTALSLSTAPPLQVSYTHNPAGRLRTVERNGLVATYDYLANSPLIEQISFAQGGNTPMTIRKQYDFLNRLSDISSSPSGSPPLGFNYQYNTSSQRMRATQADGSYRLYEYDPLGQVTSARKYWPDGTPVAGQQFEYAFDHIGNRTSTQAGGDENGLNSRSASYAANALNRYVSRTVPGAIDVLGVGLATRQVTVSSPTALNNAAPVYRNGEYFRKELSFDNSTTPVWGTVTVEAPGETPVSGKAKLPPNPEAFAYDDDGNLTSDGLWVYTWDAENRLIGMVANPTLPDEARCWITFAYDYMGRRIMKSVAPYANGSYGAPVQTVYFYDGWNLLAETDTNHTLHQAYMWGSDLSGSFQGAGGVGGLLAVSEYLNGQLLASHCVAYDGNGNVSGLVNAADGRLSAQYDYGPFGEVIRATGPMAKANPFRFSTKYQDDETDLLYFGYRYYNASTGRWASCDPIGECGGSHLYGFVYNNPLHCYDYLGREGYWSDVGTTFEGMGQGAFTVAKEVAYFAGDLLLGYVVVVTPDCCCNSLLTKLDDIGYKGSSLTAGAGGKYGGIKTGTKVFVAPVVAAASVPANAYESVQQALNGNLNAAGEKVGRALMTGGILAAPFAKGNGGTGGYTGLGTFGQATYNLTPTLLNALPQKTQLAIRSRAGAICESSLIKDMGADAVPNLQIYPRLPSGQLATWWFTADGVCYRNAGFMIREFKASTVAPLTTRQTEAFPLLEQNGGAIRGLKGGEGIPQGTVLPPIRVQIIRQTPFQPSELTLPAAAGDTTP